MLPFVLRQPGIFFGFLEYGLVDELDRGICFLGCEDAEPNLIPHPLARGGEVKVLALNGKAVDEGNAAASRMALVCPVAGFEKCGAEQANVDDLAAHAIEPHPISDEDTVFTHQNEPAEESDYEVL